MDLKRVIVQRKYQKKILLWISFTFLTMILMFSSIAYFNMKRIVLQNINQTDQKILYQMKYNTEFMDNTLKDICKHLFINIDAVQLMYGNDDNTFNNLSTMKRIEPLIVSNPFVHSVYFYNGNSGTLYSPTNSITKNRDLFPEILKKNKIVPILKPVVLEKNIGGSKVAKNDRVITYFMYEYTNKDNIPDGALIVNIKISWLLDNLTHINMSEKNTDNIFVFNEEGDFITNAAADSAIPENMKNLFSDYMHGDLNKESRKGYIERKIDGESCIITFLRVPSADLVLVKTQSYQDAFEVFSNMRITLLIITILFLVLASAVSISVSRTVYKPLERLVSNIGSVKNPERKDLDTNDEIYYLEEVYRLSQDKLIKYENDRMTTRITVKEFFLKRLLSNAYTLNNVDLSQKFLENNINLKSDGRFSVCILKIDDYREFKIKYGENDRMLIKFAIINISTEIISDSYRTEGLDMDDDRVVIIINCDRDGGSEESFFNSIENCLKKAQENILNYFNVSVSATLSERCESLSELPILYETAQVNSTYRIVYGKMSVINPIKVRLNNQSLNEYSFDFEKMLAEGVKAGSARVVEDTLQRLLREIVSFNYKSIIVSMLSIIDVIEKTVKDINSISLEPVYVDFISMKQSIFEIETIDGLFCMVSEQLKKLYENREKSIISAKHVFMAETVKKIIDSEYFDSSLCLASIAAKIKMSPIYLGKIFKESSKMSANEYINEVRLGKAVEWLKSSDLCISEILVKIGIENETYFYSLFKKKFGVPPKEYILQEHVKNKS